MAIDDRNMMAANRDVFISEDVPGAVDINNNNMPDFLFGDDPRYQACLEVAHQLKEKYAGQLAVLDSKKPDQLAQIEVIEREIVTALNTKVHEQLGDYNIHVSAGEKAPGNLYDDFNRWDTEIPLNLRELEKDTLICRHYAPIARELCKEAGLNTVRVMTLLGVLEEKNGVVTGQDSPRGVHTFVVSKATNKIIDFCDKGAGAYNDNIGNLSADQLTQGSMLFVRKEGVVACHHVIDPAILQNDISHDKAFRNIADNMMDAAVNTWKKEIYPKNLELFKNATSAGDLNTAKLAANRIIIPNDQLDKSLRDAVEKQDLPMAEFLISRDAGNFPALNYIQSKHRVLEWAIDSDKPLNEAFQRGLVKALDIGPEQYSRLAKNVPEHEALANKMIEEAKARQQANQPSAQTQEKANEATAPTPMAALSPEERAKQQALAAIDPSLLNSLSWGGANKGSGVNVGVAQQERGMSV